MSIQHQDLTVRGKVIILVLTPLVIGLVSLGCMSFLLWQTEIETERESREMHIRALFSKVFGLDMEAGSTASYYVFTKDEDYRKRYFEMRAENFKIGEQLAVLLRDRPEFIEALKDLHDSHLQYFASLDKLTSATGEEQMADLMNGELNRARAMVSIHNLFKQLSQRVQRMQRLVELHLTVRDEDQSLWRNRLKDFIVFAGAANIAAGALLAAFAGKTITDRLRYLEKNAERLSNEQPLLPPLSGKDEIAILDRAFHSMARALAETSRRERALIENALDVICSIDSNRRFVEVNPACETVWGYSAEELAGKSIDDITLEEDRLITLNRASGTVQAFTFENRILHKNGSIQHMLWSARWSTSQNVFVCVAHCITERKAAEQMLRESEAKLHTVMESMPVMLFIIDDQGIVKAANKTSESLLGYPYVELFGANLKRILHVGQRGEGTKNWMEQFLNSSEELSTRKKNGELLQLEVSMTEVYFGAQRNYLVVMLDINERHAMDVLKQEFISMLSDDLKQPIARVQTVVAHLKSGERSLLSEKGKSYLEKSEMETVRLVDLIDDLLDAERLRSGTMALEMKSNSVRDIIERSIASVQLLAEKNEIVLVNHCEDRTINCDADRIVQVLINLLSNAIKYSPRKGEIKVVGFLEDNFIRIGIADQGRGIPLSHRQAIFEQFVQVEESDARVKGGIGLGLAICRDIANKHGGTIDVDSVEGQGATFWLVLPA